MVLAEGLGLPPPVTLAIQRGPCAGRGDGPRARMALFCLHAVGNPPAYTSHRRVNPPQPRPWFGCIGLGQVGLDWNGWMPYLWMGTHLPHPSDPSQPLPRLACYDRQIGFDFFGMACAILKNRVRCFAIGSAP